MRTNHVERVTPLAAMAAGMLLLAACGNAGTAADLEAGDDSQSEMTAVVTTSTAVAEMTSTTVAQTSPSTVAETTASTVAPEASADVSDDPYCAALQNMAEKQVSGGFATLEELGVAFNAYADATEQAAALAPSDEAEILTQLVDFLRTAGEDPTTEGLAATMGELMGPMFYIADSAERRCGINFEEEAGR